MWRCDGCGKLGEVHVQFGEGPAVNFGVVIVPEGWLSEMGTSRHACGPVCAAKLGIPVPPPF